MKKIVFLTIMFGLLFVVSCYDSEEKSLTRRETIDGVPHIYNPASPIKGVVTLKLEKMIEIDSQELDPSKPITFNISAKSEDGTLYIGDMNNVNIYAFNRKGEFLKKFLSRGEGPAELKISFSTINPYSKDIFIQGIGKIIRFSNDGKLIEEIRIKNNLINVLMVDENRFICKYSIIDKETTDKSKRVKWISALVDRNGAVLVSYYEAFNVELIRIIKQIGQNTIRFFLTVDEVTPLILYRLRPEKEAVYVCLSSKYEIFVKNLNGKLLKVIQREHKGVKLSESDITEIASNVYTKGNINIKDIVRESLPETFCAVADIRVLPKGYLAVFRITGLQKFEIDVFDPDGRYIYQLKFPGKMPDIRVQFYENSVSIIENVNDRDIFKEYRITNLNEIFGDS